MSNRTPLTDLEKGIVAKLATARFPSYSASKRFARDLGEGRVKELSSRGRKFLAYAVNRFRRQYALTAEERAWVAEWLAYEEPAPEAKPLIACRAPEPVPDPQLEMFGSV